MYRLQKNNVERVVMSKTAADSLTRQGYVLLEEKEKKESQNLDNNPGKLKELDEMTVEELKEYAEKNNIDIGKSTSQSGILEKIKSAESE